MRRAAIRAARRREGPARGPWRRSDRRPRSGGSSENAARNRSDAPQLGREHRVEVEERERVGTAAQPYAPRGSALESNAGSATARREVARPRRQRGRGALDRPAGSSCRSIVGIRNVGNFALPSMHSRAIWSRTPGFANRSSTERDVLLPRDGPGSRSSVGHGLVMEEILEERPDRRDRHRIVDEGDPGQRREVGDAGVPGVEQPQLVELPVVDAVVSSDAERPPSAGARPRTRPPSPTGGTARRRPASGRRRRRRRAASGGRRPRSSG